MTDMIDEFDFSGSVGATVAKEANKGGDFAREIEYLNLKASDADIAQGKHQAILRICTEFERKPWMGNHFTPQSLPYITVKQHYAQTKQKPPYVDEKANWPAKWNAVCRKDKIFAAKYGNACHICDVIGSKPSDRTWALAIEREQVLDDNGRVIGYRDKTREVFDRDEKGDLIVLKEEGDKKEYQMKTVPAWVVLNYGWKNFFGPLSGQAQYFGTLLGRDFVVSRQGTGNNDTMYSFIPLEPITITGDWAQSLGVPDGTPYDLGFVVTEIDGRSIPLAELLYPDMPDLRRIVAQKTTDDYYGRWFVPGWLPENFDASKAGNNGQGVQGGVQQGYQPQSQPAQPQTPDSASSGGQAGPSASALDALRNRVAGKS